MHAVLTRPLVYLLMIMEIFYFKMKEIFYEMYIFYFRLFCCVAISNQSDYWHAYNNLAPNTTWRQTTSPSTNNNVSCPLFKVKSVPSQSVVKYLSFCVIGSESEFNKNSSHACQVPLWITKCQFYILLHWFWFPNIYWPTQNWIFLHHLQHQSKFKFGNVYKFIMPCKFQTK